jgi:hypothetical protein
MSRLECSVRPYRILADNSFSKMNSPNLAWSNFRLGAPIGRRGFPSRTNGTRGPSADASWKTGK